MTGQLFHHTQHFVGNFKFLAEALAHPVNRIIPIRPGGKLDGHVEFRVLFKALDHLPGRVRDCELHVPDMTLF